MAAKKRSLRTQALGYLARREYSRAELYRKLLPYAKAECSQQSTIEADPFESASEHTHPHYDEDACAPSPENIEHTLSLLLDELEHSGFLSDERFTQSLLYRRAGHLGNSRILNELKQHQLDQSLIEQATEDLRAGEPARLYAVWQKKYGQPPTTFEERIKQARFLASRGFSHGAITALLGELEA